MVKTSLLLLMQLLVLLYNVSKDLRQILQLKYPGKAQVKVLPDQFLIDIVPLPGFIYVMNNNDIVGVFDPTAVQTPQQIIYSFLQEYTIEDVDYFLWVMLRSTLSSQDDLWDYRQNRDELLFKYETMREFIAAVYKVCGTKHITSAGFNLS